MSIAPVPCPKCGGEIKIEPSYGGIRGRGELTTYRAACYSGNCNYVMDHLFSDGTKRSATRQFNREVKP